MHQEAKNETMLKKAERQYEIDLLKIFDWLRFPLIIGVIFIHNYSIKSTCCISGNWGCLVELFSQGIGRLSVPIFFFISGYLFFYKVENLDKNVYLSKLKRRIKSLLIPYLVWNSLILLVYVLFYTIGYNITRFNGNFDFTAIIRSFIGIKGETGAFPIVYQMWFIRDLFCIVLISPLIFYLISKFRLYYIGVISVLWIIGVEIPVLGDYCLSMSSIFFFSFGAYFSIMKLNILIIAKKTTIIAYTYPILLALDLIFKSTILHNITILCGLLLVFLFCGYMVRSGRLKPIPFLASSSFFVFAIHEPFLLSINRKILLSLNSSNSLYVITAYFLSVGLTVVFSLSIYYILRTHPSKINRRKIR